MNSADWELADREERLGALCSDWLEGVERGQVPDRAAWLARHAEFAAELESFLDAEERLQALAAPLREAAQAARVVVTIPCKTVTPDAPDALAADRLPGFTVSFGDYELLEEIGKGGMGVVYRARQKSLRRLVALKLFRADPLNRFGDLQRFRNEAEIIAQLDHPHVVPIHEVGDYQGQVYFSMKLIEGGGLDARLDEFRANPRAAARLLVDVARAIHHAHQRGILHRDLKPSNILLRRKSEIRNPKSETNPNGDSPNPKQNLTGLAVSSLDFGIASDFGFRISDFEPQVTDFGLAKRIAGEDSLTHSGAVVGTPAYMAPEQALGHKNGVTTAADVYGLGAILYALLTGKPPFRGATILETLEQVKERDPEPPSRANPRTPRDLETICLKCLHKEPQRRYDSAAAAADDLERWLRHEPILARPVGRLERLARWCRRQPVQAALALALLLAVALGIGLVLWQWQRAEENWRRAEDNRSQAEDNWRRAEDHRTRAEFNYETAERLRREAVDREVEVDDSFRLAHEAVKDFTTRVGDSGLLETHGLDPLRRELLQKARTYYQQFLQRRAKDPTLRRELAEASLELADLTSKIGSADEALSDYRRALALYEALAHDDPQSQPFCLAQARLHNRIGSILDALGRRDEALTLLERTATLLQGFLERWPTDTRLQHELACTHHNQAILYGAMNRVPDALKSFADAQHVYDQLLLEQPGHREYLQKLANCHNNVGVLLQRQNRPAEALEPFRESIRRLDQLVQCFPDDLSYQSALAQSLCNLGDCLRESGRTRDGMESLLRTNAILLDLTKASPYVTAYRFQLGLSHATIGMAQLALGEPRRAVEPLTQARTIMEQLVRQHPHVPDYPGRLERVLLALFDAHSQLDQEDLAWQSLLDAREVEQGLADTYPDQPEYASRLAVTLQNIAVGLARHGQFEEAHSTVLVALDRQLQARDQAPREPRYPRRLAGHYALLAMIERDLKRPAASMEATHKRLELVSQDPNELYSGCRELALTATMVTDDPGLGRRCADLALSTLRLAWKAGFRDVDRVRTDPALELLRSREEFQKLLAEMSVAPGAPNR